MKQIGIFSLKNAGLFTIKLECQYLNDNGEWVRTAGTGSYPNPQTKTINPGDFEVPNGSQVSIVAIVNGGLDKVGNEVFIYESNNRDTANYEITGTTLFNSLSFLSIS